MKKILMLFICLTLLCGCSQKEPDSAQLTKYEAQDFTAGFDTILTLSAYTASQEAFDEKMALATNLFSQYNDYFDIYNNYEGLNNLKTINDNAGIAPVEVAPEIIECLMKAKEFYELSNHEYDITLGAVLQIWHRYREEGILLNQSGELGNLPTAEELEAAKACTGWEYVEIDEENNTVFITNPCVSLDVGGIAKGFTAEKIAAALDDLSAGIINAGGNVRTLYTKPDGTDWKSGIQDPNGNGSLLILSVSGSQSIVTSGDYQRYYVASDGQLYHHIIDPQTNYPAALYRSVTVITKDSGDADALSTTLYTLSLEEGREVIRQYNEAHPDTLLSAIWIMDQDKMTEDENGFYTNEFYVTCTDDLKGKIQVNE